MVVTRVLVNQKVVREQEEGSVPAMATTDGEGEVL